MSSYIEINGGRKLLGDVRVSGSKNASLPILAATLVSGGQYELHNVPLITDVQVMLQSLRLCGAKSDLGTSSLKINTSEIQNSHVAGDFTGKFRGGLYLLSGLLSRLGEVSLGLPGGCNFDRPFNYHISSLRELGATVNVHKDRIDAKASRLKGAIINLPFPSLGATCNIIIAAVLAKGRTQINNACYAPEVVDLCMFMKGMGAVIQGIGTSCLYIDGVDKLHPNTHAIIADRVEAAAFLIAVAMTGGLVTLLNCSISSIQPLKMLLAQPGLTIQDCNDSIKVEADCRSPFRKLDVLMGPDPMYWTDWQPHLTAFAEAIAI